MRLAVIMADAGRDDWILCQVTSNPYGDPLAIKLAAADFRQGGLHVTSFARPGKLFTANQSLISDTVGQLSGNNQSASGSSYPSLSRKPGQIGTTRCLLL